MFAAIFNMNERQYDAYYIQKLGHCLHGGAAHETCILRFVGLELHQKPQYENAATFNVACRGRGALPP